ncbi:hypothetical protein RRG08_017420 [Elysia crispata]|uniref:Uncharacterized protein n=1 Tax=Elysia crispata TaxID=231223 RepID=A0AAE1CQ52_9GAST|nr:hypothetical protein RRG08_017420 [Elysia crispata]
MSSVCDGIRKQQRSAATNKARPGLQDEDRCADDFGNDHRHNSGDSLFVVCYRTLHIRLSITTEVRSPL